MESEPLNVQKIFASRIQYRVPLYQRAYVWNRTNQWERLWSDIEDKAEARIQGEKSVPHFMGAAVLEPQSRQGGLMGVEKIHIIDGQQRMTTLQYVLASLSMVLRKDGHEVLCRLVDKCRWNDDPDTMRDRDVEPFKLWPTFRDRSPFVAALTASTTEALQELFPDSFTKNLQLRKVGVDHPPALEAIWFFQDQVQRWIGAEEKEQQGKRAEALVSAVLLDLSIVCISLGPDDDAQVIFETLNGHGVELKATDLVRNYIFMRAGDDAEPLFNRLWKQYEDVFWQQDQTRGRLRRPRMEWFVQSALQAESGEEIDVGRIYATYRRIVSRPDLVTSAEAQLQMLDKHAKAYRELVSGQGSSAIAAFGRRMAPWDASTIHSLALRIAESTLTEEEKHEIFSAIESYFVRRAICGLTTKNYNKVFVQQLKRVVSGGLGVADFRAALAESQSEASRWPRDPEFQRAWLEGPVYPGRLDAPEIRAIFHRIETRMRNERTEEAVPLALDSLDIDHILPQSWQEHWPLPDGSHATKDDEAQVLLAEFVPGGLAGRFLDIKKRKDLVPTFGNLTVVHYGVNRSAQNFGFNVKSEKFFQSSNLHLNRELMVRKFWDEDAIRQRAEALFTHARVIWAGP